jgi:hypothetical protein
MAKLIITGASDDLIEISGDIGDEITHEDDEDCFLAISDGSLFRVVYDDDGIWRFTQLAKGLANVVKVEGIVEDDTFDVITLTSDTPFKWVVVGKDKVT